MSGTHFLFADSNHHGFLKQMPGTEGRMRAVRKTLRPHAKAVLTQAVQRVPPEDKALFEELGLLPSPWDLDNDQHALAFCSRLLREHDPSPDEREAVKLLEACIAAEQAGDVMEFANQQTGERARNQRKYASKQKRKPRKPQDPRRERIKAIFKRDRRNGLTFENSLAAWAFNQIDGLSLSPGSDEKQFFIVDWRGSDHSSKLYSKRQLLTIHGTAK